MSLSISMPEKPVLKPKIVVFGVGGGGCNAVNNMIGSGLEGVDFVVSNTDAQSLEQNRAERCIQMGVKKTQGLGAGSSPVVGASAAEEVLGDISDAIHGAHMVFITAGMGGGTGTGAAPVVARVAKEMGALTVGVVTKPFLFEGNRRMRVAEEGIAEMKEYIDTLLVIPNQNLFRIAGEDTSFSEAFMMADKVLLGAVGGITNLMVRPGIINLDFADVRTVMGEMGKAMIGTGEASGESRAIKAAEQALNNPLLDDVSMKGAQGVLISISASDSMKLYEVEEAMQRIRSEVDDDAMLIPGTAIDPSLGDMLKISVVATGIGEQASFELPEPQAEEGDERENDSEQVSQGEPSTAAVALTEGKPALHVVPPVPTQTQGAPSPFQGLPSQVAVAPVPSAPIAQESGGRVDAPLTQSEAWNNHPFSPVAPAPLETTPQAVPTSTAPALATQAIAPSDEPKGFFGRMKAKLMRVADKDKNREMIPVRSATSAPPEFLSKPQAPFGEQMTGNNLEEDQMEIPSFLKSQSN